MTNSDTQEVFGATGWWEEDGSHRLLHALNPKRLAYLVERCGPLAGKQVIDVGCGGGILSLALAAAGANVIGLDTSAAALDTARKQAQAKALPVEFVHSDAASYAATNFAAAAELVVCMEMLEHVADPASEIDALAALVRPGGDLVCSTINRTLPARAAMIWGLEDFLSVLPSGTHDHASFLQPSEVAQWCTQAGLRVLDIAGLNWSFFGKTFLLSRTHMPVNYLLHAGRR